jgi:hypothetical protein
MPGKHRMEQMQQKSDRKDKQMKHPSGQSKYALKVLKRKKAGSKD